ncbi:MAG: histidine kinase dimerization/phosphoacceptor domain -containing protein [Pseudomonadota bacterium]
MLEEQFTTEIDQPGAPSSDTRYDPLPLPYGELQSLVDASPDCIKLVETSGALIFMNRNGLCAMEVDNFETIRGQNWMSLWPEHTQDLVRQAMESARNGTTHRFEALCPTAKGTRKWWDVSVSPVRDELGNVTRVLATSRDISDIVERERRLREHDTQLMDFSEAQAEALEAKEKLLQVQDTLMREIDHRVKNSLAMISSLLRMQASGSDNEHVQDELNDAANRVLTVSRVHEKLYQGWDVASVSIRGYVEPLCREIRNALSSDTIELHFDLPEELISADMAIALGLIVSELLSNALRHGFEGRETGQIKISCKGDAKNFVLTVEDNGHGLPNGFAIESASGLGMKIVRLYTTQLDGVLAHSSGSDGGARFTVTVSQ